MPPDLSFTSGTAESVDILLNSPEITSPFSKTSGLRDNGNVDNAKLDDGRPEPSGLELDALIVGASWAGIWLLYRLQKLGLRVKILEASPDVGGVWYYTRYPGCRVDTEVPFYEYSMPELWQKWSWSERFPSRAEIHKYLSWVCDELDIRKNIIVNAKVTGVHWDEHRSYWSIVTKNGFRARSQFFLPCSGYTTIRHIPNINGLSKFRNKYHTSEWPEDLDYANKRVGIIGTAASGIQVIEAIAPKASRLTVFQRTPNLATPMRQMQFTSDDITEVKKDYPRLFAARVSRNGFDSRTKRRSTSETIDECEAFFEVLWQRGGLAFWFANYEDLLTNPIANVRAYNFWRKKVRARIHDGDTAEKLAPLKLPHFFGTKRPSLETAYFEVFNQSNVDLVDVNSDPITEVTSEGIYTASGAFYKLDILVLATGFDFITGSMLAMGIRGVGGRQLNEKWDISVKGEGISTDLGLMTAGFPNMFFPMGPQAPSALGLTPHMAEVQGEWIADCVRFMRENGLNIIDATEAGEIKWKDLVNDAAYNSLFGKTDSWYMGVNIPNRKKQPLCYFGGVDDYIEKIQQRAREGYSGFIFR